MYRTTSLFALLLLIPALGCGAQEADAPGHLYEAYYKVNYGDLPEWNRQYFEYAVPVLTELQASGVIEGWNQWQHQTGGDYNIRMAIRTNAWASLDTFWEEYLSRIEAATPEAESEVVAGMIQAHRDEIWDFGHVDVPEGLETSYLYASTFQYNFADGAEWYRIWEEVATPIIEQAMADGTVGGWVTLDHNTGGRHNFKVLYMFDGWDKIDDFHGKLLGTMAEQHPADFAKLMGMIGGHDDVIYVPTTQAGM